MRRTFKQYLIEAKFTPTIYAYHATRAEYLYSIIKNGLIPNKSENGYGSDEYSSEFGYSLQSLSGTYFTTKAKNSIHIAKSFAEEAIIVVCKLQPNQIDLDEDEVTAKIVDEKKLLKILIATLKNEFDFDYEKFANSNRPEEIAKQYAADIIETNPTISKQNQQFKKISYDAIYQYILSLIEMFTTSGSINETLARGQKNKLTKTMRRLFKRDGGYINLKLDSHIGFSGANKIVGLYSIDANFGWGDLGDLAGYSHHQYRTPIEFANKLAEFLKNKKD